MVDEGGDTDYCILEGPHFVDLYLCRRDIPMAMKQRSPHSSQTENPPPLLARLLSRAMRTKPLLQTMMWAKMPLFAMAGPKITTLDKHRCTVELPYRWRTKNVFNTMYFGALLMAGEATTGGLVFFHNACRPEDFSYIVRGVSADFVEKARSTVEFTCNEGDRVADAFQRAVDTNERIDDTLEVVGRREDGTEVARVEVEWTWRVKTR